MNVEISSRGEMKKDNIERRKIKEKRKKRRNLVAVLLALRVKEWKYKR